MTIVLVCHPAKHLKVKENFGRLNDIASLLRMSAKIVHVSWVRSGHEKRGPFVHSNCRLVCPQLSEGYQDALLFTSGVNTIGFPTSDWFPCNYVYTEPWFSLITLCYTIVLMKLKLLYQFGWGLYGFWREISHFVELQIHWCELLVWVTGTLPE